MWFINTMESFSAIKMNEILTFGTTWMDLDCIMLIGISETKKDKYYMISLTCIIQKQNKQETSKQILSSFIDTENRLVVTRSG